MTTPKLKPCPFCGRVKSLEIEHRTGNIFVTCGNCYAEGPGTAEGFSCAKKYGRIETDEQAIAAWNRRYPVKGKGQ